jgi:hypothetical protein
MFTECSQFSDENRLLPCVTHPGHSAKAVYPYYISQAVKAMGIGEMSGFLTPYAFLTIYLLTFDVICDIMI